MDCRRLSTAVGAGFLFVLLPVVLGSVCIEREQYWDAKHSQCVTCTICSGKDLVIRPCQINRDTICGPISELDIDWSAIFDINSNSKSKMHKDHKHHNSHHYNDIHLKKPHHDKHHKHQHKHQHKHKEAAISTEAAPTVKHEIHSTITTSHGMADKLTEEWVKAIHDKFKFHEDKKGENYYVLKDWEVANETVNEPAAGAEDIGPNWQAAVLAIGIFLSLFFFILLLLLLTRQLRPWRNMKEGAEADYLFLSEPREPGEGREFYHMNSTLYLDHLLARRQKESLSNDYVKEGTIEAVKHGQDEREERMYESQVYLHGQLMA